MSRTLSQASIALSRAAAGGLRQELMRQLLRPVLTAEALAKANATTSPKVRGGTLRRSIASRLEEDGAAVVATLTAGKDGSSAERYARLQEQGGRIVPKNGRFLAIPVDSLSTRAGVARVLSPREIPGLRFVPIRGGAAGLLVRDVAGKGKKGARAEILFRLVRSVNVPATHYLGRAVDELRERGAEAVQAALRDASGVTDGR